MLSLQWHVRDVEGATILLWDMITTTSHLTQGKDKRKALVQLVGRGKGYQRLVHVYFHQQRGA
jgi:hypothetical protein